MEKTSSSSIFSWKYLFCIGAATILLLYTRYHYTEYNPKIWNNSINDTIYNKNIINNNSIINSSTVTVAETTEPQVETTAAPAATVTSECSDIQKLFEKYATADFVNSQAKTRIASDKNAVFSQGDRVIDLGGNHFISIDDILYGYDILFEVDALYSAGSWLGTQFQSSPHDAMVLQKLIWNIKPDLIIDLGTNVGGSALFLASIMSFYSDNGTILTVDAKPFADNWVAHDRVKCKDCVNPADNKLWKKYVKFIHGSTTDAAVIAQVRQYASNATKVFVSQDASHEQDGVYQDLVNYADLVSVDSYFLVQDTKMDRLYRGYNGPLTAVRRFLEYQNKTESRVNYTFEVDRSVEIFYYSQHAHGWLKRIR